MKFTFEVALALLLLGCSSTPVVLAPVGPNPYGPTSINANGQLEVFSALEECRDGNEFDVNPAWYQHTDYNVYDLSGKRIKHVFNTVGHYDEAPCVITLPPGKYLVKAQGQGYLQVVVPVVIESGPTTRVHLDAQWKPSTEISQAALVSAPNGFPVDWSTGSKNNAGMN
jgi:hypothetical protein